ncbi:hypothetical protein HH212_00100 [Massilia forsythiae]|uniref:Uncharacterized protein n=1 Tax=Massilia forsythiae TaxID=2728020 RepID=A0A7Z2VT19_9BURK|nr:hypothetical protein [Massilia forsythiae]QJD98638.1 hypothetical protein HH212_00100 [Massilia forsythiae]
MAKTRSIKPSVQDVQAFVQVRKALVREMEWNDRPSNLLPRWKQFESHCHVGTKVPEEVKFRAHYRPAFVRRDGEAVTNILEAFWISIGIREHRVLASDTTLDGQGHNNPVIPGMPFSGQRITNLSHFHVWTAFGDKYVEPIEPTLLTLDAAIANFCNRVNLQLKGDFRHPLYGKSYDLL